MSYLVALDTSTNPPTYREVLCDSSGALVVSGTVSGEASGGSGLTDAQLRATPVPVNAAPRACVGRETIPLAAAGTASLTVPVGAVAAHIQADGATIRIRLDSQAPTATVGTRLDDGVIYPVDTALAGVRLYGVGACNVQVVYFDRA